MKNIKLFLVALVCATSVSAFARNGGDDVGNGGFAYRQSVIVLKMATAALEDKIRDSQMKELIDFPERRLILQETLGYGDLDKLSKKNRYRGTRKLAMDYTVNPPSVIVLKPYFEAFMGTIDSHLKETSLEVQKRLLHEAAHIWGYNEEKSEQFAKDFLKEFADDDTTTDPDTQPSEEQRPTNKITIKGDFCICLNGRSENTKSCDSFCATKPNTSEPILFVNTILDADIAMNPKLGNLYNWCTVQLPGDVTAPQCVLKAYDYYAAEEISLPVNISPNNNSFSASLNMLKYNTTYILKLVESKTGSQAQSKEFQLTRKRSSNPDDGLGLLKLMPVNQYTCINFGRNRDSFYRSYYYHPQNETPSPLPPLPQGMDALFVCHDEQIYGPQDSLEFPRFENINNQFTGWDKSDVRFRRVSSGKIRINNIIEERLLDEHGISSNIDIFSLIETRRASDNIYTSLTYMMLPFNTQMGKTYCPGETELNSQDPLFSILKDYISNTEGLFLAEKEGERLSDGKTVYGTMFIRESDLKKIGFYIENGLKKLANDEDFHTKTISFYWPKSTTDPLTKGTRKLFTVKLPGLLNGSIPDTLPTNNATSDKRIGCVPRE